MLVSGTVKVEPSAILTGRPWSVFELGARRSAARDLQTVGGVLSKLAQPHTLFRNIIDDIWSWQKAPDEGHWYGEHSVGARTRKEWPLLKDRLDKGKPTVLVLITQESVNPGLIGKNHQVLATGYSYNTLNKDLFIDIYDPNVGRKTARVHLNLGLPDSKLDCEHSNPVGLQRVRILCKSVRGFRECLEVLQFGSNHPTHIGCA